MRTGDWTALRWRAEGCRKAFRWVGVAINYLAGRAHISRNGRLVTPTAVARNDYRTAVRMSYCIALGVRAQGDVSPCLVANSNDLDTMDG